MRLIDANALKQTFCAECAATQCENCRIDYHFEHLAPTVEQKHGHWLFFEEPDEYYHSECSECGQWCDEDVFLKGKWHYCPNCGAKMDEEENGK